MAARPNGRPGMDDPERDAEAARAVAHAIGRIAKAAVAGDVDDEIDRAIDQVLSAWELLMDGSVDSVRRAVREAGDLATLRRRIEDGSLFYGMDSDDVARLLTNMTFSADLSGAG